jgi:hypothetical protein
MSAEPSPRRHPVAASLLLILLGSAGAVGCLAGLLAVRARLLPWDVPSFVVPLPAAVGLLVAALPAAALLSRQVRGATAWSLLALLELAAAAFSAFVPIWLISSTHGAGSRGWLELLAHAGFVALVVGSVWYAETATRPPAPQRCGRALLPWWCAGLVLAAYGAWACIRFGARLVSSGGAWVVVIEVLIIAALVKAVAYFVARALRRQAEPRWGTEDARDWVDVLAWLWVAGLAVTMVVVLVVVPEVMHVPRA